MKKILEIRGKNRRSEDIKLTFETESNGVNYINYFEKYGTKYNYIFGWNTPYQLKYTTDSGRFGTTYFIQSQIGSATKGHTYGMYHGDNTVQIQIKPSENGIYANIYENGQMIKELYISKDSYNKLGVSRLFKIRSLSKIPNFMKGV